MPHTDTIPVSASIASTGLGIRYIGSGEFQHAYAYSGDVTVADTETTCLNFITGSGYWIAKWEMHYTDNGPSPIITVDDMAFWLYLNNNIILILNASSSADAKQPDMEILIPPLTEVKVSAQNTTDASDHSVFATLVGRVYGAE